MKFKSYEEKCAAVKAAINATSKIQADLYYSHWEQTEIRNGYVPGETIASDVLPKAEEKVVVADTVTKKAAPKKKAAAKPVAKKAEPVVEKVEAAVIPDDQAQAEECPITSIEDLRAYMTTRYKDLGGTAEARASLVTALKAASGKNQASEVVSSEFAAVYAALAAL